MTIPNYNSARFENRWLREESEEIEARRTQDEAFQAALRRAIRRGREAAVEGVFVDETPPVGVMRFHPSLRTSVCGSPAQMCADTSTSGGASAFK